MAEEALNAPSAAGPLGLFAGFGVELEYMIVDDQSLSVRPVSDQLLAPEDGEITGDVERGELAWSNELVLHVVELKTSGPAPSLTGLARLFQADVAEINRRLQAVGARLMPTAMHPWMNPHTEAKLWPHENSEIYETYNRIFDCRGHGWANLQSVHLNLPFADDEQFCRLHAAIRILLPILPALAASSPVFEEGLSGHLDTRLNVYRGNSAKIPSVAGRVIPERSDSRAEYVRTILEPMYADIAPFDPSGVLQDEFLNSRGAIARFCRNAIEIRVLDIQECPRADVAICAAIVAVLKSLVSEDLSCLEAQQSAEIDTLEPILLATIRDGDRAPISDPDYLALFGLSKRPACTAGELWRHLLQSPGVAAGIPSEFAEPLEQITRQGPLARRITDRLAGDLSRSRLRTLYEELCGCLAEGRLFSGVGR